MNIGIVQMAAEPLDVPKNLWHAERSIGEAAANGAELVVLPEMFNVGFSTNQHLMKHAERLDGFTVTELKRVSRKHNVYITTSIYEKFDGYCYNTMVMVGSDGSLQFYRKRNPTCQERLVWRRADDPGPGIFDTPFGRMGGAICFDSFSKETFEGFKRSGVEMVIIVALWGTILPMPTYPDSFYFNRLLNHQSYLASTMVPQHYSTTLHVPVVYVNQCGTIDLPIVHPRFYPAPDWPDAKYEFIGNSNIYDRRGRKMIDDVDPKGVFNRVKHVAVDQMSSLPKVSRVDIPAEYMKKSYYFVQPPLLFRLYQKLCFSRFEKQYEKAMRQLLNYKPPQNNL